MNHHIIDLTKYLITKRYVRFAVDIKEQNENVLQESNDQKYWVDCEEIKKENQNLG